jgi:hypothetical protein
MTYAHPFLRLVVIGGLYDTSAPGVAGETFSFSLSLIPDDDSGTPGTVPTTVPAALITALSTFFTESGMISSNAIIRTVKLNLIGVDGRYENQETVLDELEDPIQGTSSERPAPQVALVVSLGTDFTRGRAHAGRFYLPTPGFALSTAGVITEGQQAQVAQAAWAFIEDIVTAVPGWRVGVVSDLGAGTERPVTHVRVGRVYDTIRSRRRSLDEAYYSYPA